MILPTGRTKRSAIFPFLADCGGKGKFFCARLFYARFLIDKMYFAVYNNYSLQEMRLDLNNFKFYFSRVHALFVGFPLQ